MAKPEEHPGKGNGPKQDASLTLRMVSDQNGDGLPNYGDTITFEVVAETWHQVRVECRQNGEVIYGAVLTPTAPNAKLESSSWDAAHGGAAEGVAYLDKFDQPKPLATLEFAVGA